MYAVVGCSRCRALWVVEGRPETSQCPRCRKRTAFDKLRKLATCENADAARNARSRLLQERDDVTLDSFTAMERDAEEAGVSDEAFLEASGIDPDAVEQAAESESGRSRSKREVVLDGLREQETPTAEDVVGYARDHGVSREYAERTLEKLRERGEVSVSGGVYRLL